jgi:hypothetical protein
MNAGTKLAALNKFRSSASVIIRQPVTKVLVVYDVQVKTPEVAHIPLIINYGMEVASNGPNIVLTSIIDLPKAVEEYSHRYLDHQHISFPFDPGPLQCGSRYRIQLLPRWRCGEFRNCNRWRRGDAALYRVFLQVSPFVICLRSG